MTCILSAQCPGRLIGIWYITWYTNDLKKICKRCCPFPFIFNNTSTHRKPIYINMQHICFSIQLQVIIIMLCSMFYNAIWQQPLLHMYAYLILSRVVIHYSMCTRLYNRSWFFHENNVNEILHYWKIENEFTIWLYQALSPSTNIIKSRLKTYLF